MQLIQPIVEFDIPVYLKLLYRLDNWGKLAGFHIHMKLQLLLFGTTLLSLLHEESVVDWLVMGLRHLLLFLVAIIVLNVKCLLSLQVQILVTVIAL